LGKLGFLREELQLKGRKTLPVDADVTQAKAALDKLTVYARQNSLIELQVTSEKAQASITNVQGMINALGRIQTESQHSVSTNADAARSEISSLNGMNTSSAHTIYVTKVETNATGGLVGAGVTGFADGGYADACGSRGTVASPIARAFARMSGGSVPGSGDQDTVPRTLDAGAFVLRKAAVRKYGSAALSKIANGVARFAKGGSVVTPGSNVIKRNKDAAQAQQMIELGMSGLRQYVQWMRTQYGASLSVGFEDNTLNDYAQRANADRKALEPLLKLKQLTGNEKQKLDAIKANWRQAMAQPLLYGKDLERDLMAYMEQHQGEFYRSGGLARSDTVAAMLTPGEYVVNRTAVSRFGTRFFESLNNLSLPAQALAARVQGFAAGGLVQSLGSGLPTARPTLSVQSLPPVRTVRVELAAGAQSVSASLNASDESRLLDILNRAKSRAL
jgi:phage-related minor tail protein